MVAGGRELIDTLWNVNNRDNILIGTQRGINRYIMECKCLRKKLSVNLLSRINRYIMECK